jgi:hypothetical protein
MTPISIHHLTDENPVIARDTWTEKLEKVLEMIKTFADGRVQFFDCPVPGFGSIGPHKHQDNTKCMHPIESVMAFLGPEHLPRGTLPEMTEGTGIEVNALRDWPETSLARQ